MNVMEKLLSLCDPVCCGDSNMSCDICDLCVDGKCTSKSAEDISDTDSGYIIGDEKNNSVSVR